MDSKALLPASRALRLLAALRWCGGQGRQTADAPSADVRWGLVVCILEVCADTLVWLRALLDHKMPS